MSKGSRPRKVNRKKYDAEFERIFGKRDYPFWKNKIGKPLGWSIDVMNQIIERVGQEIGHRSPEPVELISVAEWDRRCKETKPSKK